MTINRSQAMQETGLNIRSYQPQDQTGLVSLWNTVFPDDPPWNEPARLIQRKLAVQPELILVCVTQEGGVIGAVMAGFDGVRGWIHHLAVHPEHRRCGIATRLIRVAEASLYALGCDKLNLQVRA
jgi:ribosomal protein S18 acetylase RimI-like enzyme